MREEEGEKPVIQLKRRKNDASACQGKRETEERGLEDEEKERG